MLKKMDLASQYDNDAALKHAKRKDTGSHFLSSICWQLLKFGLCGQSPSNTRHFWWQPCLWIRATTGAIRSRFPTPGCTFSIASSFGVGNGVVPLKHSVSSVQCFQGTVCMLKYSWHRSETWQSASVPLGFLILNWQMSNVVGIQMMDQAEAMGMI